jgi:hypothetical protein
LRHRSEPTLQAAVDSAPARIARERELERERSVRERGRPSSGLGLDGWLGVGGGLGVDGGLGLSGGPEGGPTAVILPHAATTLPLERFHDPDRDHQTPARALVE